MNESKIKKIQGEEKKGYFTDCFLSRGITDGRLFAVNDKYLAVAWIESGSVRLVDSNNPINMSKEEGFIVEHANILDMEFSPFDNNILCHSNDNNHVIISKITGENENMNISSSIYDGHAKKVNFVNFNPIASNIMCSSTSYGELHVWDSNKFKNCIKYNFANNPKNVFWSPYGDLIGINFKNRFLNVLDPRSEKIVYQNQISELFTNSKFTWLDNNSIACIGWNRSSDKLLNLIDIRKNNGQKFNSAFHSSILIDKYTSHTTPFADPELKLIYTVAKEESYIKIFDYSSGTLKKYGDFKGTELNSFSIIFNRHLLNKQKSEIDRFARFTKKNNIFYISFILSNSQDFDGIIYPNEDLKKPQLSNEDWKNGKDLIPPKLYKKKPTQNLEITNVNDSALGNQKKRFPSNSVQQKDSSDSQNKILEKLFNIKENQNNNNQKNEYPINPQQKPFNNNPNNQQPVNYEYEYKKLEKDHIALVSDYKNLERQLFESKNAFKAKIKEEKYKYNLEINKYKNLIIQKSNELKNLTLEINNYKENEKKLSEYISRLKSQINEKNLLIDTKEKEITISNNIITNQKDNTINSLNEKIEMNSEKFSLSESKRNKYENKFKENYLKQRNITNDSEYLQEITKEKYLSLTKK